MKKKFPFEIKIITAILLSLIFVGIIGSLAWSALSGIVKNVQESVRPDAKLLMAKEIISDLSDAESSVKSYTLTRDDLYLQPFYNSISSIDNKLAKLELLTYKDTVYKNLVRKLAAQIEEKFIILNDIIGTQNDNRVETALNSLTAKIDNVDAGKVVIAENEARRKANIFDKIFRNRKKKSTKATPAPVKTEEPISNIQDQIEIMRLQEKEKQVQATLMQLDLTRKDKEVMDKIRQLIRQLEETEQKEMLKQTAVAQDMAKKANGYIAMFSILVALLLLLLCYVILSFIRRTTAYGVQLSKAKKETENMAKAKEVFLANMSHEIRTPIHAIAGFTEQLSSTALNPEQKENLEIVRKSSDHLLKLINNILDFSKLEAGKFELKEEKFNTSGFFNDIRNLMEPLAIRKNLKYVLKLQPGLPGYLIGDVVRLNQVMINLVSNAIKFTEKGEILVSVDYTQNSDEVINLDIRVSDTGIGIADENMSAVFREFEQAHAGISTRYGGTGLGLSITHKLIQLLGGSIGIKSKVSEGTTVFIRIPFNLAKKSNKSNQNNIDMDNIFLKGTKILLADDEEYNRKLLAIILNKWEVDFAEASNGLEVLEMLDRDNYDVLLLDLRMPEMDGMEAARILRQKKGNLNASIPIIALTASAAVEVQDACRTVGIEDLLVKPFKEEDLLKILYKNLNPDIPNENSDTNPLGKIKPKEGVTTRYKLDDIYILAAGNRHFVIDMINTFIKSTKEKVADIKAGVQAADWDRVSNDAHCMLGPCRHIDANGLLMLFKNIESVARKKVNTVQLDLLSAELELEANETLHLLEKELEALRLKN